MIDRTNSVFGTNPLLFFSSFYFKSFSMHNRRTTQAGRLRSKMMISRNRKKKNSPLFTTSLVNVHTFKPRKLEIFHGDKKIVKNWIFCYFLSSSWRRSAKFFFHCPFQSDSFKDRSKILHLALLENEARIQMQILVSISKPTKVALKKRGFLSWKGQLRKKATVDHRRKSSLQNPSRSSRVGFQSHSNSSLLFFHQRRLLLPFHSHFHFVRKESHLREWKK